MRWIFLLFIFLGLSSGWASATATRTVHHDEIPIRQYVERQDQCHLMYYNYCSGWVGRWEVYCHGRLDEGSVQYGTCFDLADCPGHCRYLEDVWWAARAWGAYYRVDVEIYCANGDGCPTGSPLAGIYAFVLEYWKPWHQFTFGGLPLCECESSGGKFIVAISLDQAWVEPYSDLNHMNLQEGCESGWRCAGHSYVYRNVVPYCDLYGAPGPLWNDGADYGCTNYPAIPPGCHDYFTDTGYYCEWLIDCYISCQGPTKVEETSWSEIKALYR